MGYSLGGAVSLHTAAVLADELLKMRERLRRKWSHGSKRNSGVSTPRGRKLSDSSPVDAWWPMRRHQSCSSSSDGSESGKYSSISRSSDGRSDRKLNTRQPTTAVKNLFPEACASTVAADGASRDTSLKHLDSPLRALTSEEYLKAKHCPGSHSSYSSSDCSDASSDTASVWDADSDGSGTLREILKEIEEDYGTQLAESEVYSPDCNGDGRELVSFDRLLLLAAFTDTADCAAAFLQLPGAVNTVLKNIIQYIQDSSTKCVAVPM